jgi:predicted DNA-binding WGR domain protein
LLPTPTALVWGVVLAFQSSEVNADKEYRILVDGSRVRFQWGRASKAAVTGQTKVVNCESPAAATAAALRQWAAKEAKGYWPVTGVLVGDPDDPAAQNTPVTLWAQRAYYAAAHALEYTAEAGDHLVLCQLPGPEYGVATALRRLAFDPADDDARAVVLAVDAATQALVAQLCPVALPVGSRGDARDTALVAAALAEDACGWGPSSLRRELQNVLRAARSLA